MLPNEEKIKLLAPDLAKAFPRSPHETLAGYVIGCRTLDKCRAFINNSIGEYHFNCPLDKHFFSFTEIDSEVFRSFVATGVDDNEVAEWVGNTARKLERTEIISWNNSLRYMQIKDLPLNLQEYMEDYVPLFIPKNRRVYTWFDVYDIEEERI